MNIPNPTNTSILTPVGNGTIFVSDGSGVASWNSVIDLNSNMIEFFELVLVSLGINITYDEFSKMSKEEKNAIIRDIKIKRILE